MRFLLLLFVAVFSRPGLEKLEKDLAAKAWRSIYSDEPFTYEAFVYNHAFVKAHNSLNSTFWLELNKFAGMFNEEFNMRMKGYDQKLTKPKATLGVFKPSVASNPTSVDWRDHNLVNPIKNQQQCGSCWAFSAVLGLEGQVAKVSNSLQSLSEQDFVDCVKGVSIDGQSCCNGCQGGLMDFAFKFMVDSEGGKDDTEQSYPYTAADGKCAPKIDGYMTGAKVTGYKDIAQTEADLESAVAEIGPISVAVNANQFWQLYSGGLLKPFLCNPSKLDHGVGVVGYNVASGSISGDYWIVRNSWGNGWGEQGYAYLAKGVGGLGECGVASAACYPVVEAN